MLRCSQAPPPVNERESIVSQRRRRARLLVQLALVAQRHRADKMSDASRRHRALINRFQFQIDALFSRADDRPQL